MTAEDGPGESEHARITVQRRVDWPDTDAAGHYHHSTVVRWVEAAEGVLFDRLGLSDLFGRIPRVRYEVDYRARLWFGDLVDIDLRIDRLGRTSIGYGFDVRSRGELAAVGAMTAVHIDQASGSTVPWSGEQRSAFLTAGEQRAERLV